MDSVFKKYFWVIQVLGLAAATGLAASAIMTQLGTSLALDLDEEAGKASSDHEGDEEGAEDESEDDDPLAARSSTAGRGTFGAAGGTSPAVKAAKKKSDKARVAETVLTRNVFCPNCVPEEPETVDGVTTVASSGDGPVSSTGPRIPAGEAKSALPLKLMATMEATDPAHSLATIYDGDDTRTGLYGIGDTIRPNVLVVGIDKAVVHLRNNARLEYIQIGEQLPVRPPKVAPTEPLQQPLASSTAIPGAEDAINCSDENNCIVERKFVEQLMANPAMLAKQARIVPSQRDGETQGFKFYGIRRDSLPRMLGLKNGDMLTSVNGEELKSVDQAMGLALKLRRASNLSVTLVRKGETINKEIQIQ